MKFHFRLLFLLFPFAAAVCPHAGGQPLIRDLKHITASDGLSQNRVGHMLQDRRGFMWFATWDGLNRFDGYTMRTYKYDNASGKRIVSNRFNLTLEDAQGILWFRSHSRELLFLDPQTDRLRMVEGLPDPVIDMTATRSHGIWVRRMGGRGAVYVEMREGQPQITWYGSGNGVDLPGDVIQFIHEAADESVWIGTNAGLACLRYENGTYAVCERFAGDYPVSCAAEDGENLCFGSGPGFWCVRKSDGRLTKYEPEFDPGAVPQVDAVALTADGRPVLGTLAHGVLVYDMRTRRQVRYHTRNSPLNSDRIMDVYVDRRSIVWIRTDRPGMARINPGDWSLKSFDAALKSDRHNSVASFWIGENDKDLLVVQPAGYELMYYDRRLDELKHLRYEDAEVGTGLSMLFDASGDLWIGTSRLGIYHAVLTDNRFDLLMPDRSTDNEWSNDIRLLHPYRDGLILSTRDGHIRYYGPDMKLRSSALLGTKNNAWPAYSIHEDGEGNIWLGTKGAGLVRFRAPRSGHDIFARPEYVSNRGRGRFQLNDRDIYAMEADTLGRLWIGTYRGGINLAVACDGDSVRFHNSFNQTLNFPLGESGLVRDLLRLDNGWMLVGTTNGVIRFNASIPDHERIVFDYLLGGRSERILTNNDIQHLFLDSRGTLWIATFGGGVFYMEGFDVTGSSYELRNLTTRDGLPSNIILSIIEDEGGNIWFGTEEGLCQYDLASGTTVNYPLPGRFKPLTSSEKSVCRWGRHICFGTNHGLYRFAPGEFVREIESSNNIFTGVKISNRPADTGSIPSAGKINLRHNESSFSIAYASINFRDVEHVRYAFRLDGFDTEWNWAGSQREATYTNIPPGKYTFRMISTNSAGHWERDKEIALEISIAPPFRKTWPAYMIWFLVFALVAYYAFRMLDTYSRLKRNALVEKEVSEIKLKFFTNITHEFRTPLTLITSPVKRILSNYELPEAARRDMEIISRNADRLLLLISQLLEFRKVSTGNIALDVRPVDIGRLTGEVYQRFTLMAKEKRIDFRIENSLAEQTVYADRPKIDTILYNLLSNAFKNTGNGGRITVSLEPAAPPFFAIRIADSGKGIEPEKLPYIFERFYVGGDPASGTGVGLSLVKDYVAIHAGRIEVVSEPGAGSVFSVCLRTGKEWFGETNPVPDDASAPARGGDPENISPPLHPDAERYTILVVDDNEDMRSFIRSVFESRHEVLTASGGAEALEIVGDRMPDIVLCDLLMQDKNGFEVARRLKLDPNTNHIPVILITAQGDETTHLEGLRIGIDDFVAKPFSSELLEARVENLMAQRTMLQEYFVASMGNADRKPTAGFAVSPHNREFIEKVIARIDASLCNEDFRIDDLAGAMFISRKSFYNKIRAITGKSPIEFVQMVRINRAADLIATGGYTISEVAYMVGFNDPRYFSKCFKKITGKLPSEHKTR